MKVWLKLFVVFIWLVLFKKFFPGDYVRRFLESDVRSDNRNFNDIRKTEIFTSVNKTSFGSAIVKIGPTIVMCFIEGTLAKKSLENVKYSTKQKEKDEYIDVEVSVDKNEEYETSRREKSIKESYLAIWLLNIIKKLFPNLKESLTIPNTFFYWKLVANVKVMSFQGNIQDAAFHSIMAALTTAQIPQLDPHSIKEKQMEYEITGKARLPITEKDFYLPFTFKVIDSKYILLDPNYEEEEMSDASFTIILRAETNEFLLFKHNAQLIHPGTLKEKLALCKDLAKKMFPKLAVLAKDGVKSCNIN